MAHHEAEAEPPPLPTFLRKAGLELGARRHGVATKEQDKFVCLRLRNGIYALGWRELVPGALGEQLCCGDN
jgi:hypothetical protein